MAMRKTLRLNAAILAVVSVIERREKAGGQQIDWIPDAVLADQTIQHRHHRHRHASGQTAFDARGNRINLQWQKRPLQFTARPPPEPLRAASS